MNVKNEDIDITLPILQSIGAQSNLTQRNLAKRLDLALGLTNTYLRHCIHKGLIKIEQIPANRYLYYLTPKGFAEKSRLTAKYFSQAFVFYRKASDSCLKIIQVCHQNNWQGVILIGVSELAEIFALRAAQEGIVLQGIYDPKYRGKKFVTCSVLRDLSAIPKDSVCVLTNLGAPFRARTQLLKIIKPEKILIPDILGL